MKTDRNNKKAFTLVELLVVISIIALLMAILMPALQKVRDQAKFVVCGGNLRQITLGCIAYSVNNDGFLPPGANYFYKEYTPDVTYYSLAMYYKPKRHGVSPEYNFPEMVSSYMGKNMKVWGCPGLKIPTIVDPANNRRWARYGPYYYFPGAIDYPDFGKPNKMVAQRLDKGRSSQPLIQDRMVEIFHQTDIYRFNHCRGTMHPGISDSYGDNPSSAQRATANKKNIYGGNIGFFDGSAQRFKFDDLENVGRSQAEESPYTSNIYSVMP